MKFALILVIMSTLGVGLNSLAEPEKPPTAAKDNEPQDQPTEIEDRLGYILPINTGLINRPLARPPSPITMNLIECYVCVDCPELLRNTTSKLCPYSLDPLKQGKCVGYAEQYRHMQRPRYIRGCASERGSCSDIRRAYSTHTDVTKLLSCYECEGDRCNTNSASLSLVDLTMAFFAMVVTPVVAKYTLS